MNTNPLVSVIIPTFNRANVIANAIESVLSQRYQPMEIIVVDDGSSDNTESVVQVFAPFVQYSRQKNSGPSSARNHGVRISRGSILMFLDSDDVFLPGKLERQVSLLNAAGQDIPCCIGNAILRQRSGRDYVTFDVANLRPKHAYGLWTNPASILSTRSLLFNQVVSVRRKAFIACGGFDESMRLHEDWDLALRLSLGSQWAYTTEPLAVWSSQSEDSLSEVARNDLVALKQCAVRFQIRVLDLVKANPGEPSAVAHLLRRKIANTRRELYAYRLAASPFAIAAFLGRCFVRANAACNAINRRFFYPAMEVRPLPLASDSCHIHTEHAPGSSSR